MKITSRPWLLTAIIALLLTTGSAVAGTPGESGFLSLRFPVGARETGMGGAGVASSDGAAAVYWNAARLAFEDDGTELLLQHQRSYGLFDKETAVLAHRTPLGALGVIFSGFYSDDIDRTTLENVGEPVGTFAPHQISLGVTYGRKVGERLALGAGVKLLHEEIDVEAGTGFAFDLFISHKALVEGLWLGASYTNFGSDFTVDSTPYPLPSVLRLGMAWDPQMEALDGKLTLAGDVIFPNDGTEKAHVGAEYRVVPALSLRVGSKVNYESQGLTYGAGFRRGTIEVGYAYEDIVQEGFDPQHRFTVRFDFGPES